MARYIDVEPLEDKLKEHIRKTEALPQRTDSWEKGETMSDYIKREDAMKAIGNFLSREDDYYVDMAKGTIKLIPSADVAPVRHGHWQITDAYPHNVYCSECHTKYAQTHWAVWEDGSIPRRYCPHCGARMDGESDE